MTGQRTEDHNVPLGPGTGTGHPERNGGIGSGGDGAGLLIAAGTSSGMAGVGHHSLEQDSPA